MRYIPNPQGGIPQLRESWSVYVVSVRIRVREALFNKDYVGYIPYIGLKADENTDTDNGSRSCGMPALVEIQ
jgi:hypothetical protein